ncbi:MAG TPA: hypothetical protein VLX68_04865 [Chitinivibrionales bacterium]|nr:hypothetical protein [Chitinivibrionales bacterium]
MKAAILSFKYPEDTSMVRKFTITNMFGLFPFIIAHGQTTISDDNWVSVPGINCPGSSSSVNCLALDKSGNLYAGGDFDTAGGVLANNIAKWDGARNEFSWEQLWKCEL